MKNSEPWLIVFAGQVILFGAVVLLTPYSGHGQPPPGPGQPTQNVKVVNTESEPMPVTGSVNVLNPVTVSGSVNVSNPVTVSGTVDVGNTVLFKSVIPDGAFSFSVPGQPLRISGPDPAGTSYAITSMTVLNNANSGLAFAWLKGYWGTLNSNCESVGPGLTQTASGPFALLRSGETIHLTFPQPFILPAKAGSNACLRPDNLQGDLVYIVVGYRF